jgi:hypothetical protein
MARCAVTACVQQAEQIPTDMRTVVHVAPLIVAPDGALRHLQPRPRALLSVVWPDGHKVIPLVEVLTDDWLEGADNLLR